jgi:ribosomal protein L32E
MASRSPTLRASSDPFGPDAEKDVRHLDSPAMHDSKQPEFDRSQEKRRSSIGDAWRRQSTNQESDPFGDEEEEGDVKYRTLKWW